MASQSSRQNFMDLDRLIAGKPEVLKDPKIKEHLRKLPHLDREIFLNTLSKKEMQILRETIRAVG